MTDQGGLNSPIAVMFSCAITLQRAIGFAPMDENEPKDMLEVPETTPANDRTARVLRWISLVMAGGFVVTAIILFSAVE